MDSIVVGADNHVGTSATRSRRVLRPSAKARDAEDAAATAKYSRGEVWTGVCY